MKIFRLVIDAEREEHVGRHNVRVDEVEEAVLADPIVTRTRQGRYRLIGRTDAGRYLTVIVAPRGRGVYGLVTARDADESERRVYQRHRRG